MIKKISLCFLLLGLVVQAVRAQVPGTLSYQGILVQTDGSAIADGAHSIEFNFYTTSSGGSATLTRTVAVTTSKGLYTCIIGDGASSNAALPASVGSQQLYIGIKVDGGTELLPRARLTTSAYAFQAQSAYSMDAAGLTGTIVAARIGAGTIDNTKLASGIDASKVTTGTVAIANGGTEASTASAARSNLGLGSLSTLSSVSGSEIADGTITNADISAGAGISGTKITANFGSQNMINIVNSGTGLLVQSNSSGPGVYGYNTSTGPGVYAQGSQALTANGSAGGTSTWGSSSDIRYKKDINPLTNSLTKILTLQGVTYKFRLDEFPNKNFSKTLQIGLIAQEVLTVLPEIVLKDNDGFYSMEYDRIVPVLIEAVKEQQIQIENLKSTLLQLNSQIGNYNGLSEQVAELKKQITQKETSDRANTKNSIQGNDKEK